MSLTRTKPMNRGKGIARSTLKPGLGMARSRKRLPVFNRDRKGKLHARNFGDEASLVRSLPCLVCGGLSDPAHVTSRGAGGGRFDLVPMCRTHHDEQHRVGVETFATSHGLDLRAEADRVSMLHDPPLGVRGLAQRWAAEEAGDFLVQDAKSEQGWSPCEPLTDYEREALLGWVRRRMAAEAKRRAVTRMLAAADCQTTLTGEDKRRADEFDFLADDDREALAHDVMTALSSSLDADPHGEHGQAWALCELAGRPS